MLVLRNISKHYSEHNVLNEISLTIPEKSITGIIGPNGAGKSTLIRIIAGFEFPDSGTVCINKNQIQGFKQTKKIISYMPEYMQIYPEYFVDEFLAFYHSSVNRFYGQAGHRANSQPGHRDLLMMLSLETVYGKKIKHLSKGWHQRLKLYTALCNNKPIVILDEPFDGFDPLQLRDIINIFKSQNSNGRSFIMSIHQLAYAEKICDYFIFINAGDIIAEGSLDMLEKRFPTETKSLEEIFLKALET